MRSLERPAGYCLYKSKIILQVTLVTIRIKELSKRIMETRPFEVYGSSFIVMVDVGGKNVFL